MFLVWGPLMIAGTYFVPTGAAPGWVFAASLPYALLVTVVLFGKHIDKLEADAAKGIHTLPVLLGDTQARWVAQALMISFFVVMGILVLTGTLGVWTLATFGALPRALQVMKTFRTPKPAQAHAVAMASPCRTVSASSTSSASDSTNTSIGNMAITA